MTAGDDELLQRFIDFELAIYKAASEEVRPCEGGYAMLNPTLDLVWDANDVILDEPGVSAEDADRLADEQIGGAGMKHRSLAHRIPAEGAKLAPGLEKLGWETEWTVYMELRGEPDRESEIDVKEMELAEFEELRSRLIREDLPLSQPKLPETAAQLLEFDHRVGKIGGDRWFVAFDDHGKPASACRFLELPGESVGQVEDVATLREARERGLARAVVLAAIRASREAGHEVTFIAADEADWPQLLYSRLGFETIGRYAWMRRKPPGMEGAP